MLLTELSKSDKYFRSPSSVSQIVGGNLQKSTPYPSQEYLNESEDEEFSTSHNNLESQNDETNDSIEINQIISHFHSKRFTNLSLEQQDEPTKYLEPNEDEDIIFSPPSNRTSSPYPYKVEETLPPAV